MNFAAAVAHHLCLALPAAITQSLTQLLAEPCYSIQNLIPNPTNLKVFCDEDPEDLVEVLGVVPVDGVGVVARLVPHRRERSHDQVQDGHA